MSPVYAFPESDSEAADRAAKFLDDDPFPTIPRALLSSAEIYDYVRVTGMLYPFDPKALKSASYEAHLGGRFIFWDENGRQSNTLVKRGDRCVLPANSIAFVQVEPKFRLPNYMALRFNLRITHVHRGLLLGTGPLVDPGFEGDLLIPLHNLTDSEYNIDTEKALIWIDFTKTTYKWEPADDEASRERHFRGFPADKKNLPPETYLYKANQGNVIRSSIGGVIHQSRKDASIASKAARQIRNISIGVGAFGLIATGAAMVTLYLQTAGLVQESVNLSRSVAEHVGELTSQNETLSQANRQLEDKLAGINAEVQALRDVVERLQIESKNIRVGPAEVEQPQE